MSRRNKGRNRQPADNSRQNSNQPYLRVIIDMHPDGRVEVDPKYNPAAIRNLDLLYDKAEREDYDKAWEDDHKIAFFQYQIFDEILAQYDPPPSADDVDPTPGVPSLRDSSVRDVIDIATNLSRRRANAPPLN
jgi:hypothetical protein